MSKGSCGLVILLVVLVVIFLVGPLIGGGVMGLGAMWGYGPRGGSPGAGGWAWGLAMGLGTLSMLVFWGALIVGAVLLALWFGGATSGSDGGAEGDPALDVLQRRCASGEISREEYEEQPRVLSKR
jgi:uncharacterized membrane protein